jgi:hypothetical protein
MHTFGLGGLRRIWRRWSTTELYPSQPQSSPALPTPPAQAQTDYALQSATGWQSCDTADCAGGSGGGTYSIEQDPESPSLSGSSMKLNAGGVWANALWWNKLGPNPDATNYLWDFDFQLDDVSLTAAQALEFDVFQFLGGYKFTKAAKPLLSRELGIPADHPPRHSRV